MTDRHRADDTPMDELAVTNPRARDMALTNLRWMTVTGAAASVAVASVVAGTTAAAQQAASSAPVPKAAARVAPVATHPGRSGT